MLQTFAISRKLELYVKGYYTVKSIRFTQDTVINLKRILSLGIHTFSQIKIETWPFEPCFRRVNNVTSGLSIKAALQLQSSPWLV